MSSELLPPIEANLQLQKDLQAAGLMQRRMWPAASIELADLTLSYEFFAADDLTGDFVDYLALPNNKLGFLVADVAGHGTSAALVTVALKSFVTRIPCQPSQSPANLLALLNTELLAIDLDRHVCALLGVIDLSTRELCLASAGAFPLPFLWQKDGATPGDTNAIHSANVVNITGKALGIFDAPEYSEHTLRLSKGDRLTVVTDGVLELFTDESLAEKEQKLASASGVPATKFWSALGIEPCAFGIDDITRFTLERHS